MENASPSLATGSRSTGHAEKREQTSLLAGVEKSALLWMARRTPAWIQPDHLTALGFAAMFLAGATYALARYWPPALVMANFWLAVNWLGDSMDGTLARERRLERPRYGFYVDHIIDSFGALFMIGGLAFSGYMAAWVAAGLLLGYYLLSINAYLATHTLGTFQLSYWKFSPTEIRALLAIGNVVAFLRPTVHLFAPSYRFFDVAGAVAMVCMAVVLAVSVARNTLALYRLERIPCAG